MLYVEKAIYDHWGVLMMKTNRNKITLAIMGLLSLTAIAPAADMEFYGGMYAEITTTVDGSVWIYDATIAMYEPAHITEFVITGSGAVLDIYGGKIDQLLLISTHDTSLPEGVVTVYGTDFAVDGVPVEAGTTELFLAGQTLSGTYSTGTPFSYPVDCVVMGGGDLLYYQTIKLGWVSSEPDIELDQTEVDFGQTEIGSMEQETVTVYNKGDAALTIQDIAVVQEGDIQFDMEPLLIIPLTLDPNSALDLTVYHMPAVVGYGEATLEIYSNDPNDPVVEVLLFGEGVPMPPEKQITLIIDLFKQGIEDDSIQGAGNKRSAHSKLKVMGKMLRISKRLIHAGYYEYAANMLIMVEKKCDGQKRPKDFIKGDGVAELNTMINELIVTLQNQ